MIRGLSKQGYKKGSYSYRFRYADPHLLSPVILQADVVPIDRGCMLPFPATDSADCRQPVSRCPKKQISGLRAWG